MKPKNSFKEIKLEMEKELPSLFSIDFFSMGEVIFNGKIIVGIIKFKDIKSLSREWKDINSFLTANYIVKIQDEFSKWNFYMFYLTPETVNKRLKYEIENNKFSSRKILIDNFKNKISQLEIDKIISEHITNENINLNIENKKTKQFNKNAMLSEIISKYTGNKKKKEKEADLQTIFEQIENKLKNEV